MENCRGKFIVFEGIDGTGKTTQLEYVSKLLDDANIPHIKTRGLGGTDIGEKLREIFLDSRFSSNPLTELYMSLAIKNELYDKVILPALENGICVLCDRFNESLFVYSRLPEETIRLQLQSLPQVYPDLVLLLDVPVSTTLERIKTRIPDRFESQSTLAFEIYKQKYLFLAEKNPNIIVVQDDTIENVQKKIFDILSA